MMSSPIAFHPSSCPANRLRGRWVEYPLAPGVREAAWKHLTCGAAQAYVAGALATSAGYTASTAQSLSLHALGIARARTNCSRSRGSRIQIHTRVMADTSGSYTGALSRESARLQLGTLTAQDLRELATVRYDFTHEHQRWLALSPLGLSSTL